MKRATYTHSQPHRLKQGFTLMEALIVIAIVGVLVGIAVPVYGSVMENVRIDHDKAVVEAAIAAAKSEFEYEYSGEGEYDQRYYYDKASGAALLTSDGIEGYGESSVDDADGSITGAIGQPNKDGTANYVTVVVSDDGYVSASWGAAIGKLWRTLIRDAGSTDNSTSANVALREKILAIENAQRIEADKDIILSIANYFIGKTDDELKDILGENKKYPQAKGSGAMLFNYQVDATTNSIRIGYPSIGMGWLEELGYNGKQANGKDFDPNVYSNYLSNYLFSSDDMVGAVKDEHQIYITVKVKDGMCTECRVWVKGVDYLDSDKLRS